MLKIQGFYNTSVPRLIPYLCDGNCISHIWWTLPCSSSKENLRKLYILQNICYRITNVISYWFIRELSRVKPYFLHQEYQNLLPQRQMWSLVSDSYRWIILALTTAALCLHSVFKYDVLTEKKMHCKRFRFPCGQKRHIRLQISFPFQIFFFICLRKPNLFAICNNTFIRWWEIVKDGM
jgi:hypothetical protein